MSNDDDAVGYCKPPKSHWFKKGQSGNPKGRSRKPLPSFDDIFLRELTTRVEVTEQGKLKRVMRFELVIKSLIARAIKGQPAAFKMVMEGIDKLPRTSRIEFRNSEAEDRLLEDFRARARTFLAKESNSPRCP
jgi:hypothetical protein